MLSVEMDKKTFTDVCTSCEQPQVSLKASNFYYWLAKEALIIIGLTLAAIPVILILSPFVIISFAVVLKYWWIAIPILLLCVWYRGRLQAKCPLCKVRALVPVASPKGLEVMKKHGWEPL